VSTDLASTLQAHLGSGYTIERALDGGMSRVFIAMDHRLGRRVAIKLLLPSLAATVSVERFNREIMLAAGLQHPNIVPVLHAGELEHLPYFVMPFIAGDSLRVRMMRGPLSVRETVSVMKDVARALAYAHSRGIVHRDIKPDNVLLTSGAAVVTDFGVAKALSASREQDEHRLGHTITQAGFTLGTPAYMSPEQAAADPRVDHRADLYAFGVVSYEMLAGTPPFHARTPQAILAAQISETPPPLAARRYDVPVALANLIAQCLEKEPAHRPRSSSEIARVLESPDMVSGTFAVPPAVKRRRPRRLALIAAGALTAIVAAVLLLRPGASTLVPGAGSGTAASGANGTAAANAAAARLGRSLAVLPLSAAGNGPREVAIAAGVTSELTNAVSRIPGLRVASQTATANVQRRAPTLAQVGAELGATMLLEGSVQAAGDRLRVSVRLVSVANDSTVWVDRFEGPIADPFAVQDAAARAAVVALTTRLRGNAAP
jgi:serine/threonine-protein kinase